MAYDLNSVATFVAVAETGSFRAAGERLGVSRSAISQSIAKLESDLGIALFQRTTRSMSLTEEGERLLSLWDLRSQRLKPRRPLQRIARRVPVGCCAWRCRRLRRVSFPAPCSRRSGMSIRQSASMC